MPCAISRSLELCSRSTSTARLHRSCPDRTLRARRSVCSGAWRNWRDPPWSSVISGRSLADLRERIPGEVRYCIGNHGSEGMVEANDADAMRQMCGAWVSQLRGYLADAESNAGIIIEDKGLTLSVHYRMAADRALVAQRLNALVPRLMPEPRVIGGKLVLNLLPPNARTKLEALVDLAQREACERVLFIGDDETDELVFAKAPAHWTTVRVEPDGTSRARFYIDRQSDVSVLLDQLLRLLRRPAAGHR